ncbi:hypothetical protein H0N98_05500 [Candidatus Micrarchaeota archaeon]|nr:hypothetical protein [Candidatus Micrarchaeota archaeon]
MEKELPAKGDIREAVAPYGPKEVESRLASKLGEKRMELHNAALKIVNPERKDLTVFYPSPGPDVANVLAATRATTIHLADKNQQTEYITKEINDIGGHVQKVSPSENKIEIEFEWDGKNRRVIFHQINIDKNNVDKLLADVGQYDVYFEKKSQGLSSDPQITEKFMGNLKTGGHAILDYRADNHIGLEKEPLDSKYNGEDYQYGDGRMRIHRKRRSVRSAAHIIHFNKEFSKTVYRRNGGYGGVDDDALGRFKDPKDGYGSDLIKLKALYNAIPEENREEKASIKAEMIKELYDNEIDKSMIQGSPQNIQGQIDFLRGKKALTSEKYGELMEEMRNYREPTEQQLEKFIEEGKKVFKEIFPD